MRPFLVASTGKGMVWPQRLGQRGCTERSGGTACAGVQPFTLFAGLCFPLPENPSHPDLFRELLAGPCVAGLPRRCETENPPATVWILWPEGRWSTFGRSHSCFCSYQESTATSHALTGGTLLVGCNSPIDDRLFIYIC